MGHKTVFTVVLIAAAFVATVSGNPLKSNLEELETQSKYESYGPKEEFYSVFISYRRTTSRHLAMLVKEMLSKRNITAYLDTNEIEDGTRSSVNMAQNFIVILSVNSLDLCIGDTNYEDYFHQEIRDAVNSNSTLIIPIFDLYDFPPEHLYSNEIQTMLLHQGIKWEHDLAEGSIQKVIRYLNDEGEREPLKTKHK